jgi:hypothetical protein
LQRWTNKEDYKAALVEIDDEGLIRYGKMVYALLVQMGGKYTSPYFTSVKTFTNTLYKKVIIVTDKNTITSRITKHLYGKKKYYMFTDMTIKEEVTVFESGHKHIVQEIKYSILDGYIEKIVIEYLPNDNVRNINTTYVIPENIRNSWDCKTEGHLFMGSYPEIIGSRLPGRQRQRPVARCDAASCNEINPLGFGRYVPDPNYPFYFIKEVLKIFNPH